VDSNCCAHFVHCSEVYAGMKAVVVENLKYRYPSTERLALSGVSFEVEQGEFIGIIGKTLLGNLLCVKLWLD